MKELKKYLNDYKDRYFNSGLFFKKYQKKFDYSLYIYSYLCYNGFKEIFNTFLNKFYLLIEIYLLLLLFKNFPLDVNFYYYIEINVRKIKEWPIKVLEN